MTFLLPNLSSPSLVLLQSKDKPIINTISQQQQQQNSVSPPLFLPSTRTNSFFFALPKLEPPFPPPIRVTQVDQSLCTTTTKTQDKHQQQQQQRNDFYLNLGLAVRTLREDLPLLFTKDLNYDIYRDDISFVDPLNTFSGIENYKLIFWALRFHGRILFRDIGVEIVRVWQPSENVILIRWNLRGIPRVPWEAKGHFQGTSRYKLDRNGKIYEHKVDNLAFNFPQPLKPAASVLDLVAASSCPPATPNPTFLWGPPAPAAAAGHSSSTSSWVQFYRAVRETLDRENHLLAVHDRLVTCS